MNAPTDLAFNAFFCVGDWDGYCNVTWQPVDTVNVYYRIEYHLLGGSWIWVADVPWEAAYTGTSVRFATAAPNGGPRTRIVDQIKITSTDTLGVSPPASATITTPTDLTTSHVAPTLLTRVCYGDIGDLRGGMNIRWTDLSKFVSGGRITVTKRGLTSPDQDRLLYDNSFTSKPRTDFGPNFDWFRYDLFPPGIPLDDPPTWDPFNPPVTDPRAPFWVVEGDTLTITILTYVDGDPNPLSSTFTVIYYHVARFYQYAEYATLNQPYSHQMEIIQDPWIPIAIGGTFDAPTGGMPPGLTISSAGLISGTPTATGFYRPSIRCLGLGGVASVEPIQIGVNLVNPPVIQAPPNGPIELIFGAPYPTWLSLYATNHPTSYAISSGTLPAGLSLNTSTGVISGTPNAVESPHIVNFTATNSAGTSAPYPVTFSVELIVPPTITSPNTLIAYHDELTSYQITTNLVATFYRAFDLPAGLALVGGVLTGIPTDRQGVYQCKLQALNQWGWGPLFNLQITIAIRPPEIFSPLVIEARIGEPFIYTIFGSHNPSTYGATGLPNGLSVNTATGVISGTPTVIGDFEVILIAVNEGGAGSATLVLHVIPPPVPVIDTTATHGRAITVEAFTPFIFQPAATNNPTHWTGDPVPDGLALDASTGRMSGQFQVPGLIGVVFVASNLGGDSDPATFFFLVAIPSTPAAELNLRATSTEIWINIDTGGVTIGSSNETAGASFTVKRGDTVQPTVIFHSEGVPVDLILSGLKFGAKETLDKEYVLFSDSYRKVGAGTYRSYPDFGPNNNMLDELMVEDKIVLIGEVQWDEVDPVTAATIRRSTPTFDVTILRDIVHPD
jgi:Putative Ig domain